MSSSIRQMCLAPEGQVEIMQGNIAFGVGCVRSGIHAADGYPGTPSSEVIDKGLARGDRGRPPPETHIPTSRDDFQAYNDDLNLDTTFALNRRGPDPGPRYETISNP